MGGGGFHGAPKGIAGGNGRVADPVLRSVRRVGAGRVDSRDRFPYTPPPAGRALGFQGGRPERRAKATPPRP